jgi:hypothetical protein
LEKKKSWRFVMSSSKASARAREQLQSATPVSDQASLQRMEQQAADFIAEAKRRSEAGDSISTVIDAIARNYFRHAVRRQRRRARD